MMTPHRGILWRPNPRGSQRLPGGERGDWWASFVCADGHRHRQKVGAKGLAREAHGQVRMRVRREDYCPAAEKRARPITITDMLGLVLADYEINDKRSGCRMEQATAHLVRFFGGSTPAASITPIEITKYARTRIEQGAAAATTNRELGCLRRAFRLAARAGRVAMIPPISLLAEHNVRTGFFEAGEFAAVRAALPAELQSLITFLYYTGWRLGEARALTWAQVDFTTETIRLEPGTTKNRAGRVFPFGAMPELAAVLQAQRTHTDVTERTTGQVIRPVFHRHGKPIQDLRGAWAVACRAAGVAGRLVHDLRRSAVRNLERAGVSRSVAMQLTGHKTEAVYRRYAIVAEGDLTAGVAKLAALHQEQAGVSPTVVPFASGTYSGTTRRRGAPRGQANSG
jgi:integrase